MEKTKTIWKTSVLKFSQNYVFVLDTKYYVPIKLCKMAGNIHLFKMTGTLTSEGVKLTRNRI